MSEQKQLLFGPDSGIMYTAGAERKPIGFAAFVPDVESMRFQIGV